MSEELWLDSASLDGSDLVFRFSGAAGRRASSLHPIGEDELVLVLPGGRPSGCATCTPTLERNRPVWRIAHQRAGVAVDAARAAYEATWDWLVDTL